jgi:hypothetical protein
MVQGDTSVAIQYEPINVHGLKVIANVSSSVTARFNVTPASITQVDPTANAFEGKTSWRTILEQIPGIAQAGLQNGQFSNAALPDGPFVPVQLSINGALPYETATLLDDMPLISGSIDGPPGTGSDLSSYPLNGFGAADVVRGPGAASPSIVDSIGGSFVLHAPGAVNHNHYDLSVSTDPYGGIIANSLVALHWRKLSAVLTFGLNDSPGPLNGAPIAASAASTPLTVDGMPFSCTGTCVSTSLYSPRYSSNSNPHYGYQTGLLFGGINVSTAWSQHNGSVALNYAVSPTINAEVFYVGQLSQMAGNPEQNYTVVFTPPAGYAGTVAGGSHIFSGDGFFLANSPSQRAASLFEEKITAQIGNGFFRIAALQNRTFSTLSIAVPASLDVQLYGTGTVGATQMVFNGGTYNTTYGPCSIGYAYSSNNRDFLLSYAMPLGENLHAGASFVRSYYNAPQHDAFDLGGFTGSGSTPSAVSETTNEFRVFIGGTLQLCGSAPWIRVAPNSRGSCSCFSGRWICRSPIGLPRWKQQHISLWSILLPIQNEP